MPTLRANGVDLHYDEYGTGDEVVVACQQRFIADNLAERLARPPTGYRVFAVVPRGFLPSSRVVDDLGQAWYPTWADDVVAFADQLGLGRFIYAGVSHG